MPTVYELAAHFNIRPPTLAVYLKSMQRKGVLTRTRKTRSIRLTDYPRLHDFSSSKGIAVPLEDCTGEIGHLPIDPISLNADAKEYFAMRMPDDSMNKFGILADDIVIVRQTTTFVPSDLIVAQIDDRLVLRSGCRRKDGYLELRTENPDFPVQTYPLSQVTIRGIVVSLQRKYEMHAATYQSLNSDSSLRQHPADSPANPITALKTNQEKPSVPELSSVPIPPNVPTRHDVQETSKTSLASLGRVQSAAERYHNLKPFSTYHTARLQGIDKRV